MMEAIPHVRGIDPALVPNVLPNAEVIVFCVVVLNLLVQGLSLPHLARWLNLADQLPPEASQAPSGH